MQLFLCEVYAYSVPIWSGLALTKHPVRGRWTLDLEANLGGPVTGKKEALRLVRLYLSAY